MSESYVVSARKYRPQTFSTVVGQQALTHTLKTAISSGHLAHAYLFCGPRGVGKTTCARIFAMAINCMTPTQAGEPCGQCESCRSFGEQRSFNIVELDAASNNSVDDIRGITEQVRIPPQVGKYRVFIIDEVHMLSTQAFNAFLKTLEEPPEYAIFILATTEKQKIIPTILSRCQIYDFARITVPDIVKQLQYICQDRGVNAEPAALNVIAQKADGAMRDALSIFDQVSASSGGDITYQSAIENLNVLDYDYYFRLDEAFLASDVPSALLIYREVREHGFDSLFFVAGLAQHLRDLMVASDPRTVKLLEMNDDIAQRFTLEAAKFAPGYYYRALDLVNRCDLTYRDASNKMLHVELMLIKICQLISPAPLPPGGGEGPRRLQPLAAPAQQQAAPAPQQQAAPAPQQQAAPTPQQQAAPAPQQQAAPAPQQQAAPPASAAPLPQPPVQQAPAPAPQPATQKPAARPMARRRVSISTPQPVAGGAPQAQPAAQAEPVGNSPFSAEQLVQAWRSYADQHPDNATVAQTIRYYSPRLTDGTNCAVAVNNQGQKEFLDQAMPAIVAHLRRSLNNAGINIEVSVDASHAGPKLLNERELVNDIRKRNPMMDKIITDFGLSLN